MQLTILTNKIHSVDFVPKPYTTATITTLIPFHNQELVAVEKDGQKYLAFKPIPTDIANIITDFLDEVFLVKYEDVYDIALLATNQTIRDRYNLPKEKYTAISNLIKKCLDSHLIRKFDPDNKAPRYEKYVPAWA